MQQGGRGVSEGEEREASCPSIWQEPHTGSGEGWRAGRWAGKKPLIFLHGDGGILVDGELAWDQE